jgi:hypothetical protein
VSCPKCPHCQAKATADEQCTVIGCIRKASATLTNRPDLPWISRVCSQCYTVLGGGS